MSMREVKKTPEQMMKGIAVGVGATNYVGSDRYPYYVNYVKDNVIGVYQAETTGFVKDWTDGEMKVAPFNPAAQTQEYRTIYRGKWYRCDKDGKLAEPHLKAMPLCFGIAEAYRDPSF